MVEEEYTYCKVEISISTIQYVYAVREGKFREGKQYVRIQLSVSHDLKWDNWYTTLQFRWMNKVENRLKLCNLECVDPLCFGWLG